MFNIIIHGLLIGLFASMPVGALAVLSIQKTMNGGLSSGFVIGLAAAIVDLFYATVAVLGLSIIKDFMLRHELTLGIIGSLFLVFSGIKIYRSDTIKQYKNRGDISRVKLANDFASSILIAASNPVTIIGFGSFFASFGISSMVTTKFDVFVFLLFLFLGACLWWFTLSFIVNKFRNRIRLRFLVIINRITGVVVFIMGLGILISLIFFK